MNASRFGKQEIDQISNIVENFDVYREEMDGLINRVAVVIRECGKSQSKAAARLKARAESLLLKMEAVATK